LVIPHAPAVSDKAHARTRLANCFVVIKRDYTPERKFLSRKDQTPQRGHALPAFRKGLSLRLCAFHEKNPRLNWSYRAIKNKLIGHKLS
jgi:hypothetical protein